MMRDLSRTVERHDLVYPQAGNCWQDGHILGNGGLGAICYAPYHVEWTINKHDVYDGRSGATRFLTDSQVQAQLRETGRRELGFLAAEEPSAARPLSKSCGLLKLRFGEQYSWGAPRPHAAKQRLSLAAATDYLDLDADQSHPRIRSLVSSAVDVLAIRTENVGAATPGLRIELVQPPDLDLPGPPAWGSEPGALWFAQEMPHGGAFYALAVVASPGADVPADAGYNRYVSLRWQLTVSSLGQPGQAGDRAWLTARGNVDIFLAVATGATASAALAAARELAAQASGRGFLAVEAEHRAWWSRFWAASAVELPDDPSLEADWYMSLYETACLLRQAPVPGLYGLWYGHTDSPRNGIAAAWYTHDQNAQIPVMPVFATNHPELAAPFMATYLGLIDTLRAHTRAVYERPGVCLPLTMNQRGEELPAGSYRYSLMGSAYSGLMYVWAYRYQPGDELLRRTVYPFLREVTRFYVSWMRRQPGGGFELMPLIPPEIGTLSADDAATLALFRPCLELTVEAARKLAVDAQERPLWEEVLAHYPAYPADRGQLRNGSEIPLDHWAQASYLLYPLFPGDDATPAVRELVATTFDHIVERDVEISFADAGGRWHFRRAWAAFFGGMAALRLGRVERAREILDDLQRLYRKPNGLYTHNPVVRLPPAVTEANLEHLPAGTWLMTDGSRAPRTEMQCWAAGLSVTEHPAAARLVTPVSEGNGAALMLITETLLQSHGGAIRLFPGLLPGRRASFRRLRARGGLLVSADHDGSRVTRCRIEATVAAPLVLLNPWRGRGARVQWRPGAAGSALDPGAAAWTLGELPAGVAVEFEVAPGDSRCTVVGTIRLDSTAESGIT